MRDSISKVDTGTVFGFLDATLNVRHVKQSSTIHLAHAKHLQKVDARYDITRVALKIFCLRVVSKSLSIDIAVLGNLPNPQPVTILRNADFTGSTNTNPYFFKHFVTSLRKVREQAAGSIRRTVSEHGRCKDLYNSLSEVFNDFGINYGNMGTRITPAHFIKGSFMLVLDLIPDVCASDDQTSLPDNGKLRIELKFDKAHTDAVMIILYQEFDGSI